MDLLFSVPALAHGVLKLIIELGNVLSGWIEACYLRPGGCLRSQELRVGQVKRRYCGGESQETSY